MRQLPPNPPLRRIKDAEYRALCDRYKNSMWKSPKPCLLCEDTLILRTYNHSTQEVTEWECDCIEQWMLYLHLLDSGIELLYQQLGWDDVAQIAPEAYDALVGYSEDIQRNIAMGRGLILYGPHGTGKTFFSTLLAKRAIKHGSSAFVIRFQDLLDAYTGGWRNEADQEHFNRNQGATLLVIDEVQGDALGKMKEVASKMLENLIRHRTASRLPTILTTNLEPDQIKHFGDGVMSLWAETSEFVHVPGAHFREAKKARDKVEWAHELRRPVVLE